MKKADLVATINAHQGGAPAEAAPPSARDQGVQRRTRLRSPRTGAGTDQAELPQIDLPAPMPAGSGPEQASQDRPRHRDATPESGEARGDAGESEPGAADGSGDGAEYAAPREARNRRRTRMRDGRPVATTLDAETSHELGARLAAIGMDIVEPEPTAQTAPERFERSERGERGERQEKSASNRNGNNNDNDEDNRRNRRRRRDRQTRRRGSGMERSDAEPVVSDDDVLVPVHGIVDIMEGYAFVRTSGYLASPEDAYMSMGMVRKFGLRKGDVVTGSMRQTREGERREKFSPFVQLETINGLDPEAARNRPEFAKLTPLYPQQRFHLETAPQEMTGRIVDLVSPIGKGQRGLIVSPPKAGKTMIMQTIANAITTNNPEVHLMIVLVDERPEEVTDFQRTTTGEVIASTFDRPAEDHTTISELAIERAKRLVEMGKDVVILLDGITRLGRAYNLAAPASGRILSGGVDSAALYPPKKFFGAARNIENGGSLTILATALIETGSKMDEVIFEEFKGTGNMELRLRRDLADKRIFPAIDVDASGTRREELLMGRDELGIIWKLRRLLSGMEDQASLEMLLKQMRKTASNYDFLLQISRTTPN